MKTHKDTQELCQLVNIATQTHRQTDIHTDTQKHRDTHTDTQTDRDR